MLTDTIMFLLHMAVSVDSPGQCCLLMCEAQRTWSSHPCFTLQTERISQKLAAAEQKASNQHQRLRDATQSLELAAQCSAEGNKQISTLAKQVLIVQTADKHSRTFTHSIQSLSSGIKSSCVLCCTVQCICSAQGTQLLRQPKQADWTLADDA